MNYECINMGSYNLHIIHTKKFKTITVEVNFREKFDSKNITMRNILKSVMISTNKNFTTERDLIKESENLYDLKLITSNVRLGNYSNLSFKIRFLNELYTEKSMNEYSIAFLLDIIFNPDVTLDKFREDILNKNKKKLEKEIQSIKDNKLRYTLLKLLATTKNMPYSYNSYGSIEDLDRINVSNLYKYYKKIINDNFVDVFVVGDVDSASMKEIFKKHFKANTFKKADHHILVDEMKARKRVKKVVEQDSANQSQLTMLCTLNDLTDFERKYVLLVYNELLGGSSNSLLFDTVREKNSYAYYINSNTKSYDNIMMIYSGIEPGNSENVIKLIRKTLVNITKGKFENSSLDNAKETIISSIKASRDNPAGIINTYYASVLVGSKLFEERIENVSKVSRDDIVAISKKIAVHTIYLLEGEKDEED